MPSPRPVMYPGGPTRRAKPAGLGAGAPLSTISGPSQAFALVAEDMIACEHALRELLHSDVQAVEAVSSYLAAAGGKRLRPALTALGAKAVGYEGPIARLMCVGELIHLGSLLHDDVVDDASRRRGQAAAHVVYGNAVTVLTGDFCLARAVLLASEEGGHRAVTALGQAVTAMAEGEVLQLQRAGDLSCSLEQYTEVIQKKSAALIAWCAAAAAYRAEDDDVAGALETYGQGAGIAFQITDDVLDYREGTGKRPGADLRERKVTLPLLLAMDRIDGLREELEAGPPTDLVSLIARIEGSGALEDSLEIARGHLGAALRALAAIPDNPGRDALRALGHYLVERAQ